MTTSSKPLSHDCMIKHVKPYNTSVSICTRLVLQRQLSYHKCDKMVKRPEFYLQFQMGHHSNLGCHFLQLVIASSWSRCSDASTLLLLVIQSFLRSKLKMLNLFPVLS